MLPARLELAIFGLLLEFQAHMDYETDALPTEPRKHYTDICYDDCSIPFNRLAHLILCIQQYMEAVIIYKKKCS